MKKINRIALIIFGLLLIIVLIPILLNILFKIDLGIWIFQSEWGAGDVLSFYGSLLSGLLTVVGVFLTLKHESKEKRNDEAIKYKPILEFNGINQEINCPCREAGLGYAISLPIDSNNERLQKLFFEHQYCNNPKYIINFKNVGRGETFNARLEELEIKKNEWTEASGIHSSYTYSQYIGEIIKDGFFNVHMNLPDYLILPQECDNDYFELSIKLHIIYSDMFDKNHYRYTLHILHKVYINQIEDLSPICPENFQYAKVNYNIVQIMPEKKIYSKDQNKYVDIKDL